MNSKPKWEALSMHDRAFLIKQAVKNGITDINYIKEMYNDEGRRIKLGVPYRTFEADSDYDYYNAAPENMPSSENDHWSSRNPHTGQILKSPNHPTYNLAVEGEKQAEYNIQKIGDREYSFPKGHRFSGEDDSYLEILPNGKTRRNKRSIFYHYPLDDENTMTADINPDDYAVTPTVLNPETWGMDRIRRKARRMYKGKDSDDIRSYDPNYSSANAALVSHYNFLKQKDEAKRAPKIKHKNDFNFWDAVKTFTLSNEAMDHPHPTPQLYDPLTQQQVLRSGDKQAIPNIWNQQLAYDKEFSKDKLKATKTGLAIMAAAVNPYGLIGDLGITAASTLADTAIEGSTENLKRDLGINLAFDVAGGTLQWLPKALRAGKQTVENIKALNQDFVVKASVPKVKAMREHSPKWYNFPNGYEFHFATATPKEYMGELFYAPALEKATTKTAEVNKSSLLDMFNERKMPQYETTYIQLEDKTLNNIMDEPISLYVSSSPTDVGGYNGIKGSNVDLSSSSLPAHIAGVHEKKHAVQRATNAGKADVLQYALGDYRLFPEQEALKSGYHKILADQADFLKELDTGLPPDSADTVTELVFKTNESRNIRELNATVAESLYKMFKNSLPYPDGRFMTKEMLDLYKTEIAQMTSEKFMKEFSRNANAYAKDYIRGIREIKKKDPARAEYLIKRLKDLVINQYL